MMRYVIGCLMIVWTAACDEVAAPSVEVAEQAVTCSAQEPSQAFLDYGEVKAVSIANQCGTKDEVSPFACAETDAATDAFFEPSCQSHDGEGACDYSQSARVIRFPCLTRLVSDCTSRWDDGSCLHYECKTCCVWFPPQGGVSPGGLRCFTTCSQPAPG
jgi:hypothetical protein